MALSEHSNEFESLFKVLERSKEEPWMMYVPLPRVLQIMSQTVSLSLEDHIANYPELFSSLCSAASDFPGLPKELLSIILRDSKSLDILRTLNKESISNKSLASIFLENIPLFEKLHLDVFKKLGQGHCNNIFQTENKSEEFAKDFLRHECSKSSNKICGADSNMYLFSSLASNIELFQRSLSIQSAFLNRCNFSIISIKVIKMFMQEIIKHTTNWCELFPAEFVELLYLIDSPPCIKCNCLLSTKADLQALTDQIDFCLQNFTDRDDELRIILCIKCDWLIHCSFLSSVRSLFITFI